ncbi:MAG: hypothetical protein RL172_949 [Bacteroidota bacterium]|jgi:hypothetical protein
MKQYLKGCICLLAIILPSVLCAQHFVYLQTEARQPFYVKMDTKIYNSTVSGYLIMPKMKDGDYQCIIGFIGADKGEHPFNFAVAGDAGYLIKNFGDKGWGLFNLQSLQVNMSGSGAKSAIAAKTDTNTDAFSDMLSTVVDDPAIKEKEKNSQQAASKTYQPVVSIDTAQSDPVKQVQSEKTVAETSKPIITPEIEKPVVIVSAAKPQPAIIKISTITNVDGIAMRYIDTSTIGADTVEVFIPYVNDSTLVTQKDQTIAADSIKTKPATLPDSMASNTIPPETVKPIYNSTIENKETAIATSSLANTIADSTLKPNTTSDLLPQANAAINVAPKNKLLINSNCTQQASDEDFLKLRKKMAGAKDEDEMLLLAKKVLKTRCFTTEQVKNLAVLFLTDAGRYNFFDLAYPYTSDTVNFSLLAGLLTEEYYINRFNVMLRH